MKMFIGGLGACGVHNEKYMIKTYALCSNQFTDNYLEADIILIIDTCVGTYNSIIQSIKYIENVLKYKKPDAKVIVSGCLTMELSISLPDEYNKILEQVEMIPQDKIVEYAYNLLGFVVDEGMKEKFYMPAYRLIPNGIRFSPNVGCLNHCTFCKSNFANFSLRSTPIERVDSLVQDILAMEQQGISINLIHLHASNLSLYGVDIYGKSRAHEILNILSQPDTVKFINAGALINWYPELLSEILSNPKIKCIFISLESGSERVYNLMKRPIGLDALKEIIRKIRHVRPDIVINTEFICGFPTETDDEFHQTIDLIGELDINPMHIYPYFNSDCIPAAKLEQYPYGLGLKRARDAEKLLSPQRIKYLRIIDDSELLVISVDELYSCYKVMLINGSIGFISFSEVGTGFKVGDLIPGNQGNKPRKLQKIHMKK